MGQTEANSAWRSWAAPTESPSCISPPTQHQEPRLKLIVAVIVTGAWGLIITIMQNSTLSMLTSHKCPWKEIHYFLDRLLDEQDQIGKLYIVSEERPIIACGKSVNSTHSPPTNVIFEELILMLLFRLSCHVMLRLTYVQNNLCILYLISEINRILVASKC